MMMMMVVVIVLISIREESYKLAKLGNNGKEDIASSIMKFVSNQSSTCKNNNNK